MNPETRPTDPHLPLRDDVRALGRILGDTVREQGGDDLFQRVERVRALAKRARSGRDEDFDELAAWLADLPVMDSLPLAGVFFVPLCLAALFGLGTPQPRYGQPVGWKPARLVVAAQRIVGCASAWAGAASPRCSCAFSGKRS